MKSCIAFFAALLVLTACQPTQKKLNASISDLKERVDAYQSVRLTTDVSNLSPAQKEMLPILFEVADIMDNLFWQQAWGDQETLLKNTESEELKRYIEINYGPWDRLNNNEPFIEGIGPKPAGARFYPEDMTKEEFQQLANHSKLGLYTVIERNSEGALTVVPYSKKWEKELTRASELLIKASELAEDEGFKRYLKERAKAFLSNDYYKSDLAWMEMKDNLIDFVVGPIETYEDGLMGAKAAFESYLLIKDTQWSSRLNHYSTLLPQLQTALPVDPKYKTEMPGSDSDLNVYDVIYYAGDCNAGSKTIAINLPNDPDVQMKKGSRKLQLKNSMRAKFDHILIPISELLIDPSQRQYIDFNAFFENTMFHEVAHGLGIKNTINNKGTVREALKETASAIEEGKADILGLYIVTHLTEMGELKDKDLRTNYVTFMASIFRSVRFGAASAHGKANMIRFNYFLEKEAFTRNPQDGTYKVNFEKMQEAMKQLSEEILVLQGEGDYEKAQQMIENLGVVTPQLKKDLDRINRANIPVDIVFEQGPAVIGL
ncbi:dipeptidyl-peptidase 3 family protein [Thermophagus sp. OGC60D27]|uniref:dipeptidyl-peptidase 3 family protein n=1 Tax=Thermophagus sp. OGC60D27 TaxID=3458415 RepID=UPI0040383437